MHERHGAFDGLAHVGEKVPAIGDLKGPGSAEAGIACIFGRAVPGHDRDAGPLLEPAGQRRGGAVRKQVDDAVAIQIHHDSAVTAALPHGPVVDADVNGCRLVGHRHGPDEPQHGGAARWHAEVLEETRTARAAGRMVLVRSHAERIKVLFDDEVVAEHPRSFRRDQVIYDPWHYLPVLLKKPGALRNGASFKDWDLPPALAQVRAKLKSHADGDRQFVTVLGAVLDHGLDAVETACAEALTAGLASAAVILTVGQGIPHPASVARVHPPLSVFADSISLSVTFIWIHPV